MSKKTAPKKPSSRTIKVNAKHGDVEYTVPIREITGLSRLPTSIGCSITLKYQNGTTPKLDVKESFIMVASLISGLASDAEYKE